MWVCPQQLQLMALCVRARVGMSVCACVSVMTLWLPEDCNLRLPGHCNCLGTSLQAQWCFTCATSVLGACLALCCCSTSSFISAAKSRWQNDAASRNEANKLVIMDVVKRVASNSNGSCHMLPRWISIEQVQCCAGAHVVYY